MTRKYIIVAEDSINGFDEEIEKLEREWGAEEIEPCEDCISREEALKAMCDKCPMYDCITGCSSYRHIEKMPSVTPQPYQGEERRNEMTIAEAVHTLRMRLPVGYSQTEEAAHYVVKEIVEERAIALDNKDISRFCDDFCRYPREYDEEKEGEYMTEKVCSTCPLGRL